MSPAIKKRSGCPREFREEAVRYWLGSGKRASEVAVELGVTTAQTASPLEQDNINLHFPKG